NRCALAIGHRHSQRTSTKNVDHRENPKIPVRGLRQGTNNVDCDCLVGKRGENHRGFPLPKWARRLPFPARHTPLHPSSCVAVHSWPQTPLHKLEQHPSVALVPPPHR